jgi:hypothetical protein
VFSVVNVNTVRLPYHREHKVAQRESHRDFAAVSS